MDRNTAAELGLNTLEEWWEEPDIDSSTVPDEIRRAVALVMSKDAQKSQRYALVNQLLLKQVMGIDDARQLEGLGDDNFTARSFAKDTVCRVGPITRRLGNSDDPYVNNPLRKPRLSDDLRNGRGALRWDALLNVLDAVDQDDSLTELALRQALAQVRQLPTVSQQPKVAAKAPKVPRDMAALQKDTGLDENLLLDILEVLESDQPQVILAGPPGTSKTYAAQALSSYLTDGDDTRVTTVQFHASYGYEDFIEGLRPVVNDQGALTFAVHPGVLRDVAARVTPGEKQVLILDEMNRANLPRVLGELLYAFERRDQPVDLLHTAQFKLPPEVVFIGTMNTADRSIRSIDSAVARRFTRFELGPSEAILESFYEEFDNEVDELVDGFVALNKELGQLLDRHHTIGHTYLMDQRGMTSGRLNQIWIRQILPVIEEYLFDMPDELARFTVEAFWPSATS